MRTIGNKIAKTLGLAPRAAAVVLMMAAPVLALTEVTSRMADGDLSARAPLAAPEELAALGRSFNEMAGRIEEMVATLRSFVADAAHELHTPVTALRTDLELAAADPTPELAARALTQAAPRASGAAGRIECGQDCSTDTILNQLKGQDATLRDVRARLLANVKTLRERDVSWEKIGKALGCSRQAAWERFGGTPAAAGAPAPRRGSDTI